MKINNIFESCLDRLRKIVTILVFITSHENIGTGNIFIPKVIKNKKYIKLGSNNRLEFGGRIEATRDYLKQKYAGSISIGDDNVFNQNIHITSSGLLKICNGNVFGPNCVVTTTKHVMKDHHTLKSKDVVIGNNNFFGAGVVICPGTVIGNNNVIGPNRIVYGRIGNNEKIL